MEMGRRDFMQGMAAGVAGMAALGGTAFGQAAGGPSDDLAVAIIGTGAQGRVLINDCINIPGVRFKAVCDIWPFAQRYAANTLRRANQPVEVYEDYREMLEKEKGLDAVIVATPDFVHAEHTMACLQAGLHVYCEKEMADSLESARQMVLAARESSRICQIGHQRRSNPVYRYALEMIEKDDLCGRLTNCYGQWNRSVQPNLTWPERYEIPRETLQKAGYESMDHFRNWRWFRRYSSGPIADLGSHQIDIFSWFLKSDPSALVALGGADYFPGREWYEDVMVTYEYKTPKGSARAFYQVLNTNGYGSYYERFMGDKGTLTISENLKQSYYLPEPGHEGPVWLAGVERVERDGMQVIPLANAVAAKSPEAAEAMRQFEQKTIHQWHLENFFQAVRANDKSRLTCPPEIGYETAVAVLNVIGAIEAGKKLEFSPADYKS
jgi:predicted dehydrogenase